MPMLLAHTRVHPAAETLATDMCQQSGSGQPQDACSSTKGLLAQIFKAHCYLGGRRYSQCNGHWLQTCQLDVFMISRPLLGHHSLGKNALMRYSQPCLALSDQPRGKRLAESQLRASQQCLFCLMLTDLEIQQGKLKTVLLIFIFLLSVAGTKHFSAGYNQIVISSNG